MKAEYILFLATGSAWLIYSWGGEARWYFEKETFLKKYYDTSIFGERERCFVSPEAMHPMAGNRWFQWFWEPCTDCLQRRRLGKPGDGGKWVCTSDEINETSTVISIGSNNEFSFEMAIIAKFDLKSVEVYDHTSFPPKDLAVKGSERIIFRREKMTHRKLKKIILRSAQSKKIKILKVDCEGCELELFTPEVLELLHQMETQLLIEIHWSALKQDGVVQLWERLANANYGPFHKEPNIEYSDGSCVEYSFLPLKVSK